MPENNTINQKIKNIDISKIENITLLANNGDKIKIQTANFYKIIKMLVDKAGKTEFAANELSKTYDFVIENYESELDKEIYEKIKDKVNIFIKNGGKIEIKFKYDPLGGVLEFFLYFTLIIITFFLFFISVFSDGHDNNRVQYIFYAKIGLLLIFILPIIYSYFKNGNVSVNVKNNSNNNIESNLAFKKELQNSYYSFIIFIGFFVIFCGSLMAGLGGSINGIFVSIIGVLLMILGFSLTKNSKKGENNKDNTNIKN